MGQIKRQTLGDVFGAVGHLVFKNRGGTNYISHRPVSYATPQDLRSVSIRNQFRLTSKLSKSLNSIDPIKKIWKDKYQECYSTYHKIFDSNYHRFHFKNLSGDPVLTPDKGFSLTNPGIELNGSNLTITSDPIPLDSGIDPLKNNSIITATLLMFQYKSRPDDHPVFFSIKGTITPLVLNQPVNISGEIKSSGVIVPEDEYVSRLWSVLIILDEKQNPVCYSQTIPWSSPGI